MMRSRLAGHRCLSAGQVSESLVPVPPNDPAYRSREQHLARPKIAARDEVKSTGRKLKLNPRLVPGHTLASRRVSGYQWCPCYRIAGEGGESGAG